MVVKWLDQLALNWPTGCYFEGRARTFEVTGGRRRAAIGSQ